MNLMTEINVIYVMAFANALILLATAAIIRGDSGRREVPAEPAGAGNDGGGDELARRLLERLDEIARRLEAVEHRMEDAARQPAAVPAASSGPGRYGEALRLADGGAEPGDLVSRCGLSRGEADLLVRLHGNRHRGDAARVRAVS